MKKALFFFLLLLVIPQITQSINVAIFCSGSNQITKALHSTSFALGQYLGAHNYGILTGGGRTGLMKSVCDGYVAGATTLDNFQNIILRRYANDAHSSQPMHNIRWVESIHEQLEIFYQLADIFIVLPGGFGTLLEIADCIAHREPVTWPIAPFHISTLFFRKCGLVPFC